MRLARAVFLQIESAAPDGCVVNVPLAPLPQELTAESLEPLLLLEERPELLIIGGSPSGRESPNPPRQPSSPSKQTASTQTRSRVTAALVELFAFLWCRLSHGGVRASALPSFSRSKSGTRPPADSWLARAVRDDVASSTSPAQGAAAEWRRYPPR